MQTTLNAGDGSSEIDDFHTGINASMDPSNRTKLRGGSAVTTLSSNWLYKKCEVCGHTFRLDDPVTITSDGKAYHNTQSLKCASRELLEPEMDPEILEFFGGILTTYKPPVGFHANILTPNNEAVAYLLAPPVHGFQRYHCGICVHTLRPNDIVVLCPCSPVNPKCRLAIHWDPFRGLNCWGEWSSAKSQVYCPAFSKKVENG